MYLIMRIVNDKRKQATARCNRLVRKNSPYRVHDTRESGRKRLRKLGEKEPGGVESRWSVGVWRSSLKHTANEIVRIPNVAPRQRQVRYSRALVHRTDDFTLSPSRVLARSVSALW
ncbi:MAG: hypothetical protein A3C02_01510 [Candidatus Andersenbacteria bacterium RIFCSPHIGHO2_02_FULL_45_11]|uniref:Uncharacterized protein n=1 Tax=Candidatus Andersenbacteria bacterium RIFCSPHIGHO2_12_FULL_45_11 TaxID=1797281 RepID=A0A1G1X374_9BACT|nr:MAG: hypothetical protein A2805_01175 [Candidatus Andersenbacteria bacterium RIFCSPHIGHO2_01_FULL_46_36]OGY34404.1 MAG: hypothetical protein A3D99_02730 [Candidatus Andersenbacteria bacterium RIFCSPHIGHO2_12_FULL_45_11]OGY34980.1 MAG: hypothetical protein A3C02_01510 [Candidatus Andersenbacteria bacterium RIFCSPHIGHO2_02_FULL_45_11]